MSRFGQGEIDSKSFSRGKPWKLGQSRRYNESFFALGIPSISGFLGAGKMQREYGFGDQIFTKGDEFRGGFLVPTYYLVRPKDPKFLVQLTCTDAVLIENSYSDWAIFRTKVLQCMEFTPVPRFTNPTTISGPLKLIGLKSIRPMISRSRFNDTSRWTSMGRAVFRSENSTTSSG